MVQLPLIFNRGLKKDAYFFFANNTEDMWRRHEHENMYYENEFFEMHSGLPHLDVSVAVMY